MRYFIFDTETTGVPRTHPYGPLADYRDPIYDSLGRMLEIAYMICDENGNIEKQKEYLIHKPLSFNIVNGDWHSENSGITNELLYDKGTSIDDVLENLYRRIRKCDVIMSYNIDFDINILLSECHRADRQDLIELIQNRKKQCIMRLFAINGKNQKLGNLYQNTFGVFPENTHRAMEDVRLCKELYFYRVLGENDTSSESSATSVKTIATRRGQKWTDEEEEQLRNEALGGKTMEEIVEAHQRNEGGLISRLNRIFKVNGRVVDKGIEGIHSSVFDKMSEAFERYGAEETRYDKVVRLVKNGKSIEAICNITRSTRQAVIKYIRDYVLDELLKRDDIDGMVGLSDEILGELS